MVWCIFFFANYMVWCICRNISVFQLCIHIKDNHVSAAVDVLGVGNDI
jgi:hypothetical protein